MLCLGGGECKACVAWPPQWGHLASPCVSRPPQWLQRTSVLLCAASAVRVTSGRAASARFCGCVSCGSSARRVCSASTSASRASSPACSSGSCSGGPPRVCDQRVDGSALGSTAGRVTVWVTSVAAPRSTGRALAVVAPVAARCSTASSVLAARRRASDLGERSGSSGRAPRAAQRGIMVPIYGREGKVLDDENGGTRTLE